MGCPRLVILSALVAACGGLGGGGGDGGDDDGGVDAGWGDGGPVVDIEDDVLSTSSGCLGVFNPEQVLDLRFTMAAGDWSALKADATNSVYFEARFQCNDEPALPYPIGLRRKRSGGVDKPGLKVDLDHLVSGGNFYSLRKLSLENGISSGPSGTPETRDLVGEYLAWRLMVRAGAIASRAVFVRVYVNGALIGAYVHVEQPDKRFLRQRLGHDDGWLYKKSGSEGDGYKTNETQANPYEDDLCFWNRNGCPIPSDLETFLPAELAVAQMLRFGAVNAILGNTDSPLGKDNNYYWYDYEGPRVYLPWDLDTTMKDNGTLFGGGMTTMYTDVLFTHWEDDYDRIITELLDGPLALSAIEGELDRIVRVASAALDGDPAGGGSASDAVGALRAYWSSRHPQLEAEVAAHTP